MFVASSSLVFVPFPYVCLRVCTRQRMYERMRSRLCACKCVCVNTFSQIFVLSLVLSSSFMCTTCRDCVCGEEHARNIGKKISLARHTADKQYAQCILNKVNGEHWPSHHVRNASFTQAHTHTQTNMYEAHQYVESETQAFSLHTPTDDCRHNDLNRYATRWIQKMATDTSSSQNNFLWLFVWQRIVLRWSHIKCNKKKNIIYLL